MDVVILDYGAGNIRSVQFACNRLGLNPKLSSNIEEIKSADKIIFPGVGHAASAMNNLCNLKLDLLIPKLQQPVLGICLGMQLMCNTTEEGITNGLGIFDVDVKRFSNEVKVPQMGWNSLFNLKSSLFTGVPEASYVYLVHSYYAPLCKETIATAQYGMEFSVALKKNNFFGVQFHPEKSSSEGLKVLHNFFTMKP